MRYVNLGRWALPSSTLDDTAMRFNKLDLNLLVALDALLTECSITQAAHRLHLTPSAMSSALARCRDYFQDDLLVPIGRRMEPTPRALALRDAVRDLLMRAEAVLRIEPDFDPGRSERRFSLLLSDYNNALLAPVLIRLAEQEAPAVGFDFLPQQRGQAPHLLLERGEADLLLIADPLCARDHPREVILEDRFVCIACAHHPTIQGSLSLAQFQAAGHVIMTPGPVLQSIEAQALRAHGIERRAEVNTFNFLAVPALVQGTRRIATVHARVAAQAIQHEGLALQQLQPPVDIPPVRISMQWHRHRAADPGLTWLLNTVRRAARQLALAHTGAPSADAEGREGQEPGTNGRPLH
jgi:LysR family nod box-dependent transcriptional activator